MPSNETFTDAMETFLLRLFSLYDAQTQPHVVNICGQGSPDEAVFDPDNNRCRPCPHVEDATIAFQQRHADLNSRVHYIFIPW